MLSNWLCELLKSQKLDFCQRIGLARSYWLLWLVTLWGVLLSSIPDRAIKTLGRKMEQKKKALAGELSWTRSASRALRNDCSGFSFQQRALLLFSFCSAFSKRTRAGKILFLSLLPVLKGFNNLLWNPDLWFCNLYPPSFYEKGDVVPLGDTSSRKVGRDGAGILRNWVGRCCFLY